MRAFLSRLRDAFRRRTIAHDFDAEMEFHLAELEREALARGESPEQAKVSAARAFGNVTTARESLRAQAGFPTWDELVNDLKYACRGLWRRPLLSGSVVLILTLGLGAASTIYGLVDAVFLRPLPVAHPEQLYAVLPTDRSVPSRLSRGTVRRLEQTLPPNSVAAYHSGTRCTVQIGGQPGFRASTRAVNGAFFTTLGIAPLAGRVLSLGDDVTGAPANVVVVSRVWAETNFGSVQAALGRELLVNRTSLAVVGVLPETFRDVVVGHATELWVPAALQPRLQISGNSSSEDGNDRRNDPDWNREERVSWLEILVRSRPEAPVAEAQVERAWEPQRDDMMKALAGPRERQEMLRRTWSLVHAPGGRSRFREGFHSTGWLLSGVVGVLLMLVCINVSGLLLVRSMSRHREIGVRLALGAGTFRVLRSSFLEAAVLSGTGAAGGYLVASLLLPVASRLLGAGEGVALAVSLRSLLAMGALALVAAFLSAMAPAFWISRVQPLTALAGSRGVGRVPVRLGRVLVVAQFGIAVTLVALAVALGHDLQRALAEDPGFEREHVLTAIFDPAGAGYHDDQVIPLVERLRTAALGVPGVTRVGFSYSGILVGNQWHSGLHFRDPRVQTNERSFQMDVVTPGYFATTGTRVLMGRDFAETDTPKSQPVAVASAAFARKVFGQANPIGQVVGYDEAPSQRDFTIVGVVTDIRANGVREEPPALLYLPGRQTNTGSLNYLAVRFEGEQAPVLQALRAVLAKAEPGLVFTGWRTLQDRMADDVSRNLTTARLTLAFGGCALVLAAVGVAGSLGYLVTLRQRDFAVRMAVGAMPAKLVRGVIVDALRLGAYGSLAGIAVVGLVPLVPAVRSLLDSQLDVTSALTAAALAFLAAALGGWFPAYRAARIDPLLTLKSE